MPSLQAGEAGHRHDEDPVAGREADDRSLLGDGDLDPVATAHDLDGLRVRRVEAGLHTLGHDRLGLVGVELATRH